MARTAIATLQTAWNCRWSRPSFRVETSAGMKRLQDTWACTRDGRQQVINPHECESCPFWEPQLEDGARAAGETYAVSAAAPRAVVASGKLTVDRLLYVATWLLVAVAALLFFAVGLSVLTTPLSVPIALTFWLIAGALVGFALTGYLPHGA